MVRYQRNIMCKEFGEEGQRRLLNSNVTVVGSGGLGGFVLQEIVVAGVGNIKIVEFDTIAASNLNRQILFRESQIGESKAAKAKERLQGLNSEVSIVIIEQKVTRDNYIEILEGSDIVVDCTDNYEVRYLLDEWCWENNIPLIHGSVQGMEGVVTTFLKGATISYSELYGSELKTTGVVAVLSPIVGLVGSLQAAEVIKLATGAGEPLFNKLAMINLLNNSFQLFDL